MSTSKEKIPSGPPVWLPGCRSVVEAALQRRLGQEETMARLGQIILHAMRDGWLNNFGDMQEVLTVHKVPLSLVAVPLQKAPYPSGTQSIDLLTGDSRQYVLMMTVGEDSSEMGQYLAELRQDPAVNVERLRSETGFPVWIPPQQAGPEGLSVPQ